MPRIPALLLSTGLVAASIATCAVGTAQAAGSGVSDGLLLVQHPSNNEFYTENPDGTGSQMVGGNYVFGFGARYSADGTFLAYSNGYGAGTYSGKYFVTQVTPQDTVRSTSWSVPTFVHSDGAIVYAATPVSNNVYQSSRLYIGATDGLTPARTLLTPPAGYSDWAPTSHGDTVYFVRSADTGPAGQFPVSYAAGDLMRLDLATGAVTKVMSDVLTPEVSADGTEIVFVRDVAGVDQLFTAAIDGSAVTQVTTGTTGHEYPAWSPTGTRVSYSTDGTATDQGKFVQGASAVHVLTLSSGNDIVADTQARGFSSWQAVGVTGPAKPAMPSSSVGRILASRGASLVLDDGGTETTLATDADTDSGSWYPAADRVVFSVGSAIVSERRDGSDRKYLYADAIGFGYGQPSVCPDATAVIAETFGSTMVSRFGTGLQTASLGGTTPGYWVPYGGGSSPTAPTTGNPQCVADGSVYADHLGGGTPGGIVHIVRNPADHTTGVTETLVVPDGYDPAVSPDGKSLAYIGLDRFGVAQLFVSGLDGSNPVQLTSGYFGVYQPTWSPDGTMLAVDDTWYGGVIEVSAQDGTVLGGFAGATHPRWEPTEAPTAPVPPAGSAGPITTNQGGNLLETPGSRLQTGTTDNAAWFPTGNRYVYSANGSLWSAKPDGTDVIRLSIGSKDVHPAVSRDSALVVFMRSGAMYTVASDGTRQPYQVSLPAGYNNVDWPTWLSDDTLAFQADGPSGTGVYHRLGNGTVSLLIPKARQAAWSPAGDRVAYLAPDAHGLIQLFVAGATGTGAKQLTFSDHTLSNPAWSPDGTQIAYADQQFGYVVEVGAQTGVPDGQAPGAFPAWVPGSGTDVVRVWGADRLSTAIAASQYVFAKPASANAVVLSRSDLYADALGGSSLAVRKGGPLLITPSASLDPGVAREISRALKPGGMVYLLGGPGALSPAIEGQIRGLGFTPVRLGGANRFQTAILIAQTVDPTPGAVLIATGTNFKDALAAGATGLPVVLTDGSSMPPDTARYLNGLNPDPQSGTELVTVGGPGDRALIAGYQAGMMPSWPGTVSRFPMVGAGAMDTAVMVAQDFTFGNQAVALATVAGWPDALSGGAMIGNLGGPLLLTDPSGLYGPDASYLATQTGSLTAAIMLGGAGALPNGLIGQISEVIGVPGHVGYTSVTPAAALPAPAVAAHPGGVTLRTSGAGTVPSQAVVR